MNIKDFTNAVKKQGEYKNDAEAKNAIQAVVNSIVDALSKKEDVSLANLGIFTTAIQKGRTGTVPGTDRTYTTEDKYVPKFKAGKNLKASVAGLSK